jgi:hypothetical protein
VHRLEIRQCDQPIAVADQLAPQPVQVLIAGALVQLQMAGRVKRDRVDAAGLAVDPHCGLLSHRPARKDSRRLHAEQLGHPLLEPRHQLAVAVVVGPVVSRQRVGRRPQAVARGDRRIRP